MATNVDNSILPFDSHNQSFLLNFDIQVLALEISRNSNSDIEIANRLSPAVGESSLFLGFFCACSFLLLGSGLDDFCLLLAEKLGEERRVEN